MTLVAVEIAADWFKRHARRCHGDYSRPRRGCDRYCHRAWLRYCGTLLAWRRSAG